MRRKEGMDDVIAFTCRRKWKSPYAAYSDRAKPAVPFGGNGLSLIRPSTVFTIQGGYNKGVYAIQ